MTLKKILGSVTALALSAASLTCAVPNAIKTQVSAVESFNYAEVLQKSLYFYECQQAGPLPEWNRVEWKGDATMNDYIKGGWYDAGDHVKFNLPMAYSAAMIAWGLYQYPDGVKKCGELTNYVNNLEFVLDYLAECDLGDEAVYQVGNGTEDHRWWGPVELYEYGQEENGNDYRNERPYYKASEGCSAVFGEMAAALAAGACALDKVKSISASKKAEYIAHAENLFKLADDSKSDAVYKKSDAQNFYDSSHFYDELFWSANWLYIATGEKSYLDKAKSYIPNLGKELGSDELKYSWAQCWDDVQQGGLLLYAQNTGDDFYISRVKRHLDHLADEEVKVDGKLVYIQNWGCLRYATACGFVAAVACDTLPFSESDKTKYKKFYEDQINYSLGDNPLNMSYVVGYGDKYPMNPHHRTAHSSWKNDLKVPETNRHIIYGALVGGPTQAGEYEDDRNNHINNEITTDYNAGFTGLLCKMVDEYGGETDSSFPEPEVRDDELYVEAMIKQSSTSGVTLSLKMTNHTAWPARVVNNLSYRYYFDVSEIIAAGFKPEDIEVRVDRDQAKMYGDDKAAEFSPITQYKDNIYYIEVTYKNGEVVLPISEGRHQCETMLALVFPNYGSGWDAENDYSNQDLIGAEDPVKTDKITVYENGVLIYGTEPDGTKPEKSDPSVKPEPSKIKGDVNIDGKFNVSDAVLMSKYLTKQKNLTEQGAENGDMNEDKKLNVFDLIIMKKQLAK